MFFDQATIEGMFDAETAAFGQPLVMALFDKRHLWPLSDLPEHVANGTGEVLLPERLGEVIDAGWLPALSGAGQFNDQLGFALYAPGRVGLFLKLEREGVTQRELSAYAEHEEHLIDCVLTGDEMPYDDDDLAVVRRAYEEELAELEEMAAYYAGNPEAKWAQFNIPPGVAPEEVRARLDKHRTSVAALNTYKWDRLRPDTKRRIMKNAFNVRMRDEWVRLHMIQSERAAIAQGYSFFIQFCGHRATGIDYDAFTFGPVDWTMTLRSPWLTGEDDSPPIRLPGLVIDGNRVRETNLHTPAEYARLWEQFDLDGYRRALAESLGTRICCRCLRPLPEESMPLRKFCSARCKNAAKAQAWRERHPDRVKLARHNWKQS